MNEKECLDRMIAPGQRRPTKWLEGVIQIIVTSSCNLGCYACTQASNLSRKHWVMTPEQFEQAVLSLGFGTPTPYFGVVGVFGGNPPVSKYFDDYCAILRKHVPFKQRGLWSNDPLGKGKVMRKTFNPAYSNLNVHTSKKAYEEFKRDWPECSPCGLDGDSRHSPPWVAMKDVVKVKCNGCDGVGVRMNRVIDDEGPCPKCNGRGVLVDESRIHELISNCDINQFWSAALGIFRGELRAWFCEIAAAQSMLHQDDPTYPDTGLDPIKLYDRRPGDSMAFGNIPPVVSGPTSSLYWWQLPMANFVDQVRKHCFDCGVPLRGRGELSQSEDGAEQVSETHADLYKPKKKGRRVELVTLEPQLYRNGKVGRVIEYLQNGRK